MSLQRLETWVPMTPPKDAITLTVARHLTPGARPLRQFAPALPTTFLPVRLRPASTTYYALSAA